MKKPVKILLVEDNPADRRWIVEIFKEYHIPCKIHTVKDGGEALNFLYKTRNDAYRPQIIILDLYLPRISGREVLEKIKNDENLSSIPVVILTASNSPGDAEVACINQVNCYLSKPINYSGLMEIIHRTGKFGLTVPAIHDTSKYLPGNVFNFKHHHI